MENEDVRKTFFDRGVVFFTSTSAWTAKDKLRPSDIGKQPVEIPDIVKLGSKDLLPEDLRVSMTSGARTKVSAFMKRVGTNFTIGDNNIPGAWFVTNRNLLAANEGLKTIRKWMDDKVEEFLTPTAELSWKSPYEDAKDRMVAEYSWLVDAVWPSADQIRQKYNVAWKVCEITGTDAKSGDPEEIIEAKKQFRKDLDDGFNQLKDSILSEAHVAIQAVCEDISKRITETGTITVPAMKRPLKIVKQYLDVAEAFDDEKIKEAVLELKATIMGTSAEKIREDWEVAEQFASAMKKIGENVGDLSAFGRDGRPKRKVRLDPEPEEEREAA